MNRKKILSTFLIAALSQTLPAIELLKLEPQASQSSASVEVTLVPGSSEDIEGAAHTLFLKAKKAFDLDDRFEGFSFLNEAVKLDPKSIEAYKMMAQEYWNISDNQGTIKSLEPLLEIIPDDAQTWSWYGNAVYDEKKFLEAEKIFRKCIMLQPSVHYHHVWLAKSLLSQNKFDEAGKALKIALELKPDSEYTLFVFANYLILTGKLKEGKAALRKALEIRPDYSLAITLLNDPDRAGESFYICGTGKNDKKTSSKISPSQIDIPVIKLLRSCSDNLVLEHGRWLNESFSAQTGSLSIENKIATISAVLDVSSTFIDDILVFSKCNKNLPATWPDTLKIELPAATGTVDYVNVPVSVVTNYIAMRSNRKIVVSPELQDFQITCRVVNKPWFQILQSVSWSIGAFIREEDKVLYLIPIEKEKLLPQPDIK